MINLLSALEDWTEAIESGFDIDVIYTDFAKAFNSVPHQCLLKKTRVNRYSWRILEMDYIVLNRTKAKKCVLMMNFQVGLMKSVEYHKVQY